MDRDCATCPLDVTVSAGGSGRPPEEAELPLKEACELFERQYVMRVLHRVQWNISRAARVLRVHRNTILRKLAVWGVQRPSADERGTGS
jgi:DNA-binding NtrC family response regulator